jgi:hypothetical protein
MTHNELQQLLIEYAEGTLDSTRKTLLENELKKSSSLRNELADLKSAFEMLQQNEDVEVPSHYYATFLPRLREKLDRNTSFATVFFPSWLQRAIVPATVAALCAVFFGVYHLLKPEDPSQALASIVRQSQQEELEQLISESAPFSTLQNGIASSNSFVNSQILAKEVVSSSSLYDNVVSDTQILAQLDEQDVEFIVNQLNAGSVQ